MKEKLLEIMRSRGMDAYLVSKHENIRYLSGYTGYDAWLFLTEDKSIILTDPRCEEQARTECPGCEVINWREYESVGKALGEIIRTSKVEKMAVEKKDISLDFYRELEADAGVILEGLDDVLEEMRSIKTPEEIQYLKNACDITCKAFYMLLGDIRIGATEKELESKLSYYMVTLGGDTKPNFNLLISGTRTSLLHGMPSSKAIEYGDLILMDFGIEYKGYTSDMTRVVSVGRATQEKKDMYAVVNQMLTNCLNAVRDGVRAVDVCEASFGTIRGTKYEPHYYPSIGHGVGLFVHEVPFLRPNSTDILRENNVMAVEPGIFIPGWGGIHLEDNILVTKDGYENLTSTEKRLIEL